MAKKKRKAKGAAKKRKAGTKARKTTKRTTAKKRKTTKKAKTKKTAKRRTAKAKTKTKRKPNAAFMAPMVPSPALAEIVGSKALPRTQVVKKLWAYIRKHNLQDPNNRRNIRADQRLQKVFGGRQVVSMFDMTKLVSKQLKAA